MAKIKGSALKASLSFLEKELGTEGVGRLVSELPEAARNVFSEPILQGSWYEFDLLAGLMEKASPLIRLPGGRSLAWEMGRYSAEHGLTTIYKVFFKMADPGFIIRKASQVFSTYYDSGSMTTVERDSGRAVIQLTGFDQPSALFCERILGWMERTLELCGAKHVVMSHPRCTAKGDPLCEYRGTWE